MKCLSATFLKGVWLVSALSFGELSWSDNIWLEWDMLCVLVSSYTAFGISRSDTLQFYWRRLRLTDVWYYITFVLRLSPCFRCIHGHVILVVCLLLLLERQPLLSIRPMMSKQDLVQAYTHWAWNMISHGLGWHMQTCGDNCNRVNFVFVFDHIHLVINLAWFLSLSKTTYQGNTGAIFWLALW